MLVGAGWTTFSLLAPLPGARAGLAEAAGPAAQAPQPTVEVEVSGHEAATGSESPGSAPSEGTTPGSAALRTEEPLVSGTVVPGDQDGTGTIGPSVSVVVTSERGGQTTVFSLPTTEAADGTWTFAGRPPEPLLWNGAYEAVVRATETDRSPSGSVVTGKGSALATFLLSAPPASPADVAARAVGPGEVLVTWAADPERDLYGYVVERSGSTTTFSAVGRTAATSFEDRGAPEGTVVGYRVLAVRAGATASSAVWSTPSAEAFVRMPPAASGAAPGAAATSAGAPRPPRPVLDPLAGLPAALGPLVVPSAAPPQPAPVVAETGQPLSGPYSTVLPYPTPPPARQVGPGALPASRSRPKGSLGKAESLALGALLVATAAWLRRLVARRRTRASEGPFAAVP
jgi:hypothetical protein